MKMREITMTVAQARDLQRQGVVLKTATLYQTMGPQWREIVWITSTLGRTCYVCNSHSVNELHRMVEGAREIDVWHAIVTKVPNGTPTHFFFKTATDLIISAQRTWHRVPGVYKIVEDDKIEFRDRNRDLLLVATRLVGDVKKNPVTF